MSYNKYTTYKSNEIVTNNYDETNENTDNNNNNNNNNIDEYDLSVITIKRNQPQQQQQQQYTLDNNENKEINTKKQATKKQPKKSKKQNEKEIIKNYTNELKQQETETTNNEPNLFEIKETKTRDKKIKRKITSNYENIEYFTPNEKNEFENKFVKPKNKSQETYVNVLNDKEKKIVITIGPAGTGKTLFATQYGIRHFLLGNFEKLIFTRPTVSVDEDIGFLPGTIEEKLSPWLRPIFDILYEFITVKEVQCLLEEKIFEIAPIGYLRGRTFKKTFIIADEMQNCTQNQMKMLLTRLGENSRMVITGDLEQHDRTGEINGLADFLNKLKRKRSDSISMVEFEQTDILREPVIKEILEIYSLV